MHPITINWEYKPKFHFSYGELHIVFCTMKVLGKTIDARSLDMSLSKADIYGIIKVEQINSGKHDHFKATQLYICLYIKIFYKNLSTVWHN